MINGTDFVFLPITNFETAEKFYGGVLGLRCSASYSNGIGGEFETGTLTIQLIDMARIGRDFAPSRGAIALRVDDVADVRARLEAQDVRFVGETMDTGVCHQAIFEDPDGNHLILHHRYAPKD
jgi:catechol 2,3-dioxygenase-like lactoylglutathione lyase family enzyme